MLEDPLFIGYKSCFRNVINHSASNHTPSISLLSRSHIASNFVASLRVCLSAKGSMFGITRPFRVWVSGNE